MTLPAETFGGHHNAYQWAQDPLTGEAVPVAQTPNLIMAIVYDGSHNAQYIGLAAPGSLKSAAVWQIRKLTVSGTDTTDVQYANASPLFNAVMNDYASLSYS